MSQNIFDQDISKHNYISQICLKISHKYVSITLTKRVFLCSSYLIHTPTFEAFL